MLIYLISLTRLTNDHIFCKKVVLEITKMINSCRACTVQYTSTKMELISTPLGGSSLYLRKPFNDATLMSLVVLQCPILLHYYALGE